MGRTQDEIVARIGGLGGGDDFFGFRREVLILALDEGHAAQFVDLAESDQPWKPLDVERHARDYLTFAVGKIADHRGISAGRSVDKLTECAWLLGRDDVVAAMTAAEYPQYGAPQVKAFADGMGWAELWPADDPDLARMAAGEPCSPDCAEGCGT